MRIFIATVAILCLLAGPLSGQASSSWDPSRLQVSRVELGELLTQYEAVAQSSAYSSKLRGDARESAARIRERLEQGDFRVGDRIVLRVRGEDDLPDTLQVQPGPVLVLGTMGEIPLAGILRSELQDHLARQLSRYLVQEPVVYARSMVRLAIEGQIGRPGFHVMPADMLLDEALMAAGGPGGNADMKKIRVVRGETVLLDGAEIARALVEGRSLDQLNIRAGDRIELPERRSSVWSSIGSYGLIVLSTLLLGTRIF